MVKHCIACGSRIYRRELLYIHDALQLRWAVIGVEDARIPTPRGNEHVLVEHVLVEHVLVEHVLVEHVLVEAAKQGWKQGSNGGNGIVILQHYDYHPPQLRLRLQQR